MVDLRGAAVAGRQCDACSPTASVARGLNAGCMQMDLAVGDTDKVCALSRQPLAAAVCQEDLARLRVAPPAAA